MADYIAAIDCGTTGAKAVVFDTEGTWHGTAYKEYECTFPSPNRVEQDAEQLFEACVDVLAKAVRESGSDPSAIKALSFSTQRCTVIPVDTDCKPLRAAISWQDNRSDAQCDEIRETFGDAQFYQTTGLPIANVWALPSIMWIRDEEPDIYASTHKLLNPHGFLLKRFGADRFVEDLSNASLHGLVSVAQGDWDDDFIARTKLDKAKLPDLITSGTVVGTLSADIIKRTGLRHECVRHRVNVARCLGSTSILRYYGVFYRRFDSDFLVHLRTGHCPLSCEVHAIETGTYTRVLHLRPHDLLRVAERAMETFHQSMLISDGNALVFIERPIAAFFIAN